jgi:hypothetical protein
MQLNTIPNPLLVELGNSVIITIAKQDQVQIGIDLVSNG